MRIKKKKNISEIHASFLSELSKSVSGKGSAKYKKHSFEKTIGISKKPGLNFPIKSKENFLKPGIKIQPEAFSFLFFLGGCSKNLLLYILVQMHDDRTGHYSFTISNINDFINFCSNHFEVSYSIDTVKQEHRKLVKSNVTLNVNRGTYFLNPLIAGGNNEAERRSLIREYTDLLRRKKKDPVAGIYPTYEKIS
jgi:hypothetical protein